MSEDKQETLYPRGSEWRRWDLHVHAYNTIKENMFSCSLEEYVAKIEQSAKEIAVIGITDYCRIDGYKEIIELKKQGRMQNIDLVLPNIEFRVSQNTQGHNKLINIHLIVSPDDGDHVEKLEEALRHLTFKRAGTPYSCSKEGLKQLGRAIKTDATDDAQATKEAIDVFCPSFEEFRDWYSGERWLQENSIIVVPNSNVDGASGLPSNGSQREVRKELYRLADAIFSSNPNDRKYFLGDGVDDDVTLSREIGGIKPCIHGSDAHKLDDMFHPEGARYCWIKADPTFAGLMQIINEPRDRVFIGKVPPKLEAIQQNSFPYLKSITISPTPQTVTDEWFDGKQILLNPSMIAIIGNKGSGKSALSDILGLVGDTKHYKDFTFLEKNKFRDKKLAEKFQVAHEWGSGKQTELHNLNIDPDGNKLEQVKYLPQKYLERVCAGTTSDKDSEFQRELRDVIFTHIKEENRLGKDNLEDLIETKTNSFTEAIDHLRDGLASNIDQLVRLDKLNDPDYLSSLREKLDDKNKELTAHKASPPKVVADIKDGVDGENSSEEQTKLQKLISQLDTIEKNEEHIKNQISAHNINIDNLEKTKARLEGTKQSLERFAGELTKAVVPLGLSIEPIFSFSIDTASIESKILEMSTLKDELNNRLYAPPEVTTTEPSAGASREETIQEIKARVSKEIEKEKSLLTEQQAQRQKLLDDKKAWEEKIKKIELEIAQLGEQIKYITLELKKDLRECQEACNEVSLSIYDLITKQKAVYEDLFRRVQEVIEANDIIKSKFNLKFASKINQTKFASEFLSYISSSPMGSYCGSEQAQERINKNLQETDFNSRESASSFLALIFESLRSDQRGERDKEDRSPHKQLKSAKDLSDLYSYILNLDYLKPDYLLTFDGKELKTLSSGERGALLLVFYLLVDNSNMPLVIDQPEENLDNNTVFNLIVPLIKEAKKNRQIIMVTHNPNIAVVCDAEQVIHASIHRDGKTKITYTSGSIEEPIMNKKILDILEGTRAAFNNRDSKYFME